MPDKIDEIIKQRNITPTSCDYHTIRVLDNNGKVRALVIKGESIVHIELICPKCGSHDYHTDEWKPVSKAAKIRFTAVCPKCGEKVKVEKLKGGKQKKEA
jgi:hypothetical protein